MHDAVAHRCLISLAIVMNACSTFVASLADVSRNGMPRPSANSCKPSGVECASEDHSSREKQTDFRLFVINDALGDEIALVADEQLVDILASIAVDLLEPLTDVVERDLVSDVVHDDDAVRAAIIGRRDGAETLRKRATSIE